MRVPSTRRAPRGFTLVELLIVMVLLGLVGSAITTVVVRQQRFYRGANEIIETRNQIRQAAFVMPTELRGMSTAGGDLLSIAPQELEFRAPIGTSIYCEPIVAVAGTPPVRIALPPQNMSNGNILTSFLSTPAPGDDVYVWVEGTDENSTGDRWETRAVVSRSQVPGTYCVAPPLGTHYTSTTDAFLMRETITLDAALPGPDQLRVGAAVRIARRVRYRLYQAPDGNWYLGYQQRTNNAWGDVQPVSGPYLAGDAAAEGDRGLRFRVYDRTGAEVTALPWAQPISRVDIVLRAETQQAVQLSGTAPTRKYRDSLNVSIAIRNWQ